MLQKAIAPKPNGSSELVPVTYACSAFHPQRGQSPLSTCTDRNSHCSHRCAHSRAGLTCRHPSLGKMWGDEQPIIVERSFENSHARGGWGSKCSSLQSMPEQAKIRKQFPSELPWSYWTWWICHDFDFYNGYIGVSFKVEIPDTPCRLSNEHFSQVRWFELFEVVSDPLILTTP